MKPAEQICTLSKWRRHPPAYHAFYILLYVKHFWEQLPFWSVQDLFHWVYIHFGHIAIGCYHNFCILMTVCVVLQSTCIASFIMFAFFCRLIYFVHIFQPNGKNKTKQKTITTTWYALECIYRKHKGISELKVDI